MTATTTADTADREIRVSRVYDAPPELLFDTWIDTAHISSWWGPRGFTTTTHESDVRPGGRWRFTMHGPDGRDYENLVKYREIRRPELLTYTHHGGDEEEVHFEAFITFERVDGGTRVTLRSVLPTKEARDHVVREYGAIEGAHDTLARLGEHVAAAATSR